MSHFSKIFLLRKMPYIQSVMIGISSVTGNLISITFKIKLDSFLFKSGNFKHIIHKSFPISFFHTHKLFNNKFFMFEFFFFWKTAQTLLEFAKKLMKNLFRKWVKRKITETCIKGKLFSIIFPFNQMWLLNRRHRHKHSMD